MGFDEIKTRVSHKSKAMKLYRFEIDCPTCEAPITGYCGGALSVKSGIATCPACETEVRVSLSPT